MDKEELLIACLVIQKKITRHTKKEKHSLETKDTSESDSDITRLLVLSDYYFKTTMTNKLKTPVDKVDIMQKQKDNIKGDVEILIAKKKCQ